MVFTLIQESKESKYGDYKKKSCSLIKGDIILKNKIYFNKFRYKFSLQKVLFNQLKWVYKLTIKKIIYTKKIMN